MSERTAYLVLENGKVFTGRFFGAEKEVVGEIVFTTAMTGYLETLTDPSYYGQIVVQTFPLIGNYGVIPADFESKAPALSGYIVRDVCDAPSNFRSEGELDRYLKQQGIPGLCGIDTRALTRIVREAGVMNAKIAASTDDLAAILRELKQYSVEHAVASVGTDAEYTLTPDSDPVANVVLWDFGAKKNIARELVKRGCRVTVVPSNTTAKRILALDPDGLMLSNGPGDPAENVEVIEQLRLLLPHRIPTFGICLGHQLLALAHGGATIKLKYGHRGANQPATECATGRVYITSQNHGYAVVGESLPQGAAVSFVNANDGTCEGVSYDSENAFSVQFHPEASAGPLDTSFLFDRFIQNMQGGDR
ncbi:MAG: glutamine-hydrolyzing carbamoyl-phosphate synthase small subunit [Clostridia bacterium]|nr:glutamine-hydrolyzing carbamoyl-phosphate synthase small subunit [Clostridia bacterium]